MVFKAVRPHEIIDMQRRLKIQPWGGTMLTGHVDDWEWATNDVRGELTVESCAKTK